MYSPLVKNTAQQEPQRGMGISKALVCTTYPFSSLANQLSQNATTNWKSGKVRPVLLPLWKE